MRIRKNARLVTSSSSSSSSSSFLVCQLNRSPWDVDSFSLLDGFGLSGQVFPSSDSLPNNGDSMELSFEYVDKSPPPPPPPPPPPLPLLENEDRENRRQRSIIHHQLPPIPTAPKKRGRPKKPTSTPAAATATATTRTISTNNNPYEYYYYSGFGPRWGCKRRGGNKCHIAANDDGKLYSWSNNVTSEDDDEDDNQKINEHCNTTSSKGVGVRESMVDDEVLDYIDDDFDDDDGEDKSFVGRRFRKPVKARSLKSLM